MISALSAYLCPVCTAPLALAATGKSYLCKQGHCFDMAKEGYLNLLPVQHKHSSEPGDSKAMLSARRAFLEAGHYEPLAHAISAMLNNEAAAINQPLRLLDIGCGEGYYSRTIHTLLPNIEWHGLDIAKFAIAAAAKKLPNAHYVVASSKRLPYCAQYFDAVLRVFAPSDEDELRRVLKPSGRLLIVTPGPRHLAQLKAFIYHDVREHADAIQLPAGFTRITSQRLSYWLETYPSERAALLQMTPFAWRANHARQQALQAPEILRIETDFILSLAEKNG